MSRILPFDDWPEADRAMWIHLTTARDVFDDAGALSHLSARSLRHLQATYGQWLCWLQSSDTAALDLPPTQRATLDRLQLWREAPAHTQLITQRNCITVILRILQAASSLTSCARRARSIMRVLLKSAGQRLPSSTRCRS